MCYEQGLRCAPDNIELRHTQLRFCVPAPILYRLNRETLRRLAALIALPHRDAGGFDMAAEAVGVEQRASRAIAREPGSQLRQQGLQKGSVPFIRPGSARGPLG